MGKTYKYNINDDDNDRKDNNFYTNALCILFLTSLHSSYTILYLVPFHTFKRFRLPTGVSVLLFRNKPPINNFHFTE